MTEYGIKVGYALAGFFGGVASLRYVQGLTVWQAILAVFTGLACANYLTPTFLLMFTWIKEPLAAAFVVGLTATNILPVIIKLTDKILNNWIKK